MGYRSPVSSGALPSIGSPSTLNSRPSVGGPTGTEIGAPVLRTSTRRRGLLWRWRSQGHGGVLRSDYRLLLAAMASAAEAISVTSRVMFAWRTLLYVNDRLSTRSLALSVALRMATIWALKNEAAVSR